MCDSEDTSPGEESPRTVEYGGMLFERFKYNEKMDLADQTVYVHRSNTLAWRLGRSKERMIVVGPFRLMALPNEQGHVRLRALTCDELTRTGLVWVTCNPEKCDPEKSKENNGRFYRWPYDFAAGQNDKGDCQAPPCVNRERLLRLVEPSDTHAEERNAAASREDDEYSEPESDTSSKKRPPPEQDDQQEPSLKRCKSFKQ